MIAQLCKCGHDSAWAHYRRSPGNGQSYDNVCVTCLIEAATAPAIRHDPWHEPTVQHSANDALINTKHHETGKRVIAENREVLDRLAGSIAEPLEKTQPDRDSVGSVWPDWYPRPPDSPDPTSPERIAAFQDQVEAEYKKADSLFGPPRAYSAEVCGRPIVGGRCVIKAGHLGDHGRLGLRTADARSVAEEK